MKILTKVPQFINTEENCQALLEKVNERNFPLTQVLGSPHAQRLIEVRKDQLENERVMPLVQEVTKILLMLMPIVMAYRMTFFEPIATPASQV